MQVLVAVLGGGLPVGALAAVVVILVVTRRRYHHPPMSAVCGAESTSGIATLSDVDCDVMNNRRLMSKVKDYAAGSRSSKDMVVVDALRQSESAGGGVDLPPGRCAKVSNVERQRTTRGAPDSRGIYTVLLTLLAAGTNNKVERALTQRSSSRRRRLSGHA